MDPNIIQQGLTLSAIGLVLTFTTLGLMVLPIWIVNRYQEAHAPQEPLEPAPREEPGGRAEEQAGLSEAEVAAAIALSVLAARRAETSPSRLGAALEIGPGRWWTKMEN